MIKKSLFGLLMLLLLWICADLLLPRQTNLREFDPEAVARLDARMWRSYYERRKGNLFFQLARLMRTQFGAPVWRSYSMAFRAARAATLFQVGRDRRDYARALPHLEKYFQQIHDLSIQDFDVKRVAANELEWWIIRREPQYTHADWQQVLAQVSALLYDMPASTFDEHARMRVAAMKMRDDLGEGIREPDWKNIEELLIQSWTRLYEDLH